MPGSAVSVEPEVFTRFQHADEGALEHIFRDAFPALTADATAATHDPVSAAHVVEDSFLDAWAARDHIAGPAALEEFLRQTVHVHAVRESSRRAALHRFQQFEGEHAHAHEVHIPTTDEAWEQLLTVLHAPRVDLDEAARKRALASRHEAAQHVTAIATKRSWKMPVAVIVAAAAAMAVGGWWLDRAGEAARVDSALQSTEARLLSTQRGQRATVTLADASTALLGPESSLKIAPDFGPDLRVLGLTGTASFEVAPQEKTPFIVKVGQTTLTATGTTFDVSAFPDADAVLVRVRTGSVTAETPQDSRMVHAGGAVSITADGSMSTPAADVVQRTFAWLDGQFIVENSTVKGILPLFRRWYKLDLQVADPALMDRPATVRASLDSPEDALAALQETAGVKLTYDKQQTMILVDATKGKR